MKIVFGLSLMAIFTLPLISFSQLFAQSADTTVEIRLKLIQEMQGSSVKSLALSISIINHSDRNIYVPDLRFIGYLHGIHLFQKQAEGFEEMDLLGQRGSLWGKNGKLNGDQLFIIRRNNLSEFYWNKNRYEFQTQDSLIKLFYKDRDSIIYKYNRPGNQPIFLKAREELNDFGVYSMDHILDSNIEYKIIFEPRKIDVQAWPYEFLGYNKWPSSSIFSNILYYSLFRFDKINNP
jgi:hypothetical protein